MPLELAGFDRLVFLLVREPPALLPWLFWGVFLQSCDLHLGWLPGWFSRAFLQNVPRSITWTDVISHISSLAESPGSSRMGRCCSVIIAESLPETDRSKPESQSAWWETLQNCSVTILSSNRTSASASFSDQGNLQLISKKLLAAFSGIDVQCHHHSINNRKRIISIFFKLFFTTAKPEFSWQIQSISITGKCYI